MLQRSQTFSDSYIKHGENYVAHVIFYIAIQRLVHISEDLHMIFEFSTRAIIRSAPLLEVIFRLCFLDRM
jgi:hypothetical protein